MAPHASTWHRHYEKAWGRIKKKVNKNLLFFSLSYKHRVDICHLNLEIKIQNQTSELRRYTKLNHLIN